MLATVAQAVELSMERSQSLAKRRHRPSHANVRSTTHRRGKSWKSFCGIGALIGVPVTRRYASRPQGGARTALTSMLWLWRNESLAAIYLKQA